jgi:hypothetical protein
MKYSCYYISGDGRENDAGIWELKENKLGNHLLTNSVGMVYLSCKAKSAHYNKKPLAG